jgi:hypothetical protein
MVKTLDRITGHWDSKQEAVRRGFIASAIPDAQLVAAFRQCDGRDRAEPAGHHAL